MLDRILAAPVVLLTSLTLSLAACGGSGGADGDGENSTDSESGSEASESNGTQEASSTAGDGDGDTGVAVDIDLLLSDNPDMSVAPFADIAVADATEVRIIVSQDGEELFTRVVDDIDPDNADSVRTFVWGLEADTTYEIRAQADLPEGLGQSDAVSYTTGSLPADVPDLTVSMYDETRAHEGIVFFGSKTNGVQVYVGVNPEGKIVWYHVTGGEGNKLNGDLKRLDDGRFMLLTPSGLRIVEPWGEVVTDYATAFHHDLSVMPNGNYLILGRQNETINVPQLGGDVQVLVDTLEEVTPSGDSVRFWRADDHLDTQYFPSQLSQDGPPYDWTHGNAAYYDAANDRVLLSARHLHWVVAIEWSTGDVEWRMGPGGDFTLDGPVEDWFYGQHAPEPDGDNRVLVYDNGNERPDGSSKSRAVVIEYDETDMSAHVAWEHEIIPQTPFLGDADRLSNGNVLMAAGGTQISAQDVLLIETTGDDPSEVVWRLTIDNGGNTYRATHLDSL